MLAGEYQTAAEFDSYFMAWLYKLWWRKEHHLGAITQCYTIHTGFYFFIFFCYGERVMKRAVFFADVSLTLNRMTSGQQERSRCRKLRGSKNDRYYSKKWFSHRSESWLERRQTFLLWISYKCHALCLHEKMRETEEPWAYCITLCHNYFTGVKAKNINKS